MRCAPAPSSALTHSSPSTFSALQSHSTVTSKTSFNAKSMQKTAYGRNIFYLQKGVELNSVGEMQEHIFSQGIYNLKRGNAGRLFRTVILIFLACFSHPGEQWRIGCCSPGWGSTCLDWA